MAPPRDTASAPPRFRDDADALTGQPGPTGAPESRPVRPATRVRTSAAGRGTSGPLALGWRGAIAAVACLIAVGSLVWALGLRTQLDQRQADLEALRDLSTAAALGDNATAWTLTATADGPPGAIGNVFYSEREQRLALVATGLPALPAGQSYRLWFVDGGSPPGGARLAGTFQTAADGSAALVMPNVPPGSVVGVAVTAAPDADTGPTPTTPFLLVGSVSAAG